MRPKKNNKTHKILAFLLLMLIAFSANSQSISAPGVADACFVRTTDTYSVSASVNSGILPNNTPIVLRLSNKQGAFNINTIIIAETTSFGSALAFNDFSYPPIDGEGTTTGSDEYRLRIETKDGSVIGTRSSKFSVFFYDGTRLELGPTPVLCEFGTIAAVGNPLTQYVWHRIDNIGNDVVIQTGSESSIEANIEGRYYYTPPLGDCAGFLPEARSNFVIVFEESDTDIPDFTIKQTDPNEPLSMCDSESVSFEIENPIVPPVGSTFVYQWVRDGEVLAGQTGTSITVTGIEAEGTYELTVSDDADRSVNGCSKRSGNSFFVDLKNPFINFPQNQSLVVIDFPGQDEVLNVEVTGEDPKTITWIKNDIDIPSSNSTSFTATGPGEYKARVNSSVCPGPNDNDITKNLVQVINIDNLSLSIDYDIVDYTPCIQNSVGLKISEISTDVNGTKVVIPTSSFNPNSISWFFNGAENPVATGDRFLIENAGGNGSYQVKIDIDNDGENNNNPSSNVLDVKLNSGGLQIEIDKNNLNQGDTATIEVVLPEGAASSQYTYQWFRNGVLIEGETQQQLEVNIAGGYTAEVAFSDCPAIRLEEILVKGVSQEIPNVITPNGINNNKWEITSNFTGNPNVEVQILSTSGKQVFKATNYNGEWPNEELKESVYYYIISENGKPVKKGSITIIR